MCGCKKNNQPIQNNCMYTLEFLTNLLNTLTDPNQINIVQNAISNYTTNCNQFNNELNAFLQ